MIACAAIHDLMDDDRPRDAGVEEPLLNTSPQPHSVSARTKRSSLQTTGLAAWAQAGLEQKSGRLLLAVISCTRFGRITSPTSCAVGRQLRRKNYLSSGGGNTG